jgi:RNA polymerase sigma-70 factor (ECF subfamily)
MEARSRSEAPRLATATSTTLLDGLRDPEDHARWTAYVDRYRPLIVRFARGRGLPPEPAEDVAQASLLAFAEAYRRGRYERDKGRLRSWLFGIVRHQLRRWWRTEQRRELPLGSDEEWADAAVEAGLEERWEEEWRGALLRQCLEEIRREVEPATLVAFELFAVEGLSAEEVGRRLSLSPNAVYGAKRRVLRRVRELMPLMDDAW